MTTDIVIAICCPPRSANSTARSPRRRPELGAAVIANLLGVPLSGDQIGEVILGRVLATGSGQTRRASRSSERAAAEHPAVTINAVCGSGLKAVMLAAQASATATTRSASPADRKTLTLAPRPARLARGQHGRWKMVDSMITDGLFDIYNRYHMGHGRERRQKLRRQPRQAGCARARLAAEGSGGAGRRPLQGRDRAVLDRAESDPSSPPTSSSTARPAPRRSPAQARVRQGWHFDRRNASGINDGAAYVASRRPSARRLGLTPLARITSYATVALDPASWAWARCRRRRRSRAPAGSRRISTCSDQRGVRRAGLRGQQRMGWDTSKVNVNGGASRSASDRCIGLPHPGDAAARNGQAQRQEGDRVALHRRWHGGGAVCRALILGSRCELFTSRRLR